MVGRREFIAFSLLSTAGYVAAPNLLRVAGVLPAYAASAPNGSKAEEHLRVAVLQPVFTSTAYSPGGFYDWYRRYAGQNNVTDLNGLDLPVNAGWGFSYSLASFANSSYLLDKASVEPTVVNDLDVHGGKLFEEEGRIKYSHVIIGHSEYVTSKEYNQLRAFVYSGGNLIFLDGNALYAEVEYYIDPQNVGRIRLRKGHGWEVLDGKAVKSVNSRWRKENLEWIGSDYFGGSYNISPGGAKPEKTHPIGAALAHNFGDNVFSSYNTRREDTVITDPEKVEIIARFNGRVYDEAPGGIFASYTKRYGKGRVFHFGGFGDDVILYDPNVQFLVTSMINYRRRAAKVNATVSTHYDMNQTNEYDALSNEIARSTVKIRNLGKTNLNLSGWKVLECGKLLAVLTDKTVISPYETLQLELPPRETNNPLFLYDNNLHFVCQLEIETIEEEKVSIEIAT